MKFRKKPVVIEAVRLDGSDVEAVGSWIAEHGGQYHTGEYVEQIHGRNRYPFDGARSLWIRTLEGDMRADPGDWIIRGVQGEFYPIKDSIFRETYEPVS